MSRWKKKSAADEPTNTTVLRLSIFGFSRLSASDQKEKTEEICNKLVRRGVIVLIEQQLNESEEDFRLRTFTELFNKLAFPETNLFLCSLIKKFKRERQFAELISSFRQLDANGQQQLIGRIVDVKADEDSIRRFTQLSRDYTGYVYKHLVDWHDDKKRNDIQETSHEIKGISDDEISPDWQSRFSEFFSGFSIIWFKGKDADGQILLIEKLSRIVGVEGADATDQKISRESEEDLTRLTRFTELCGKAHHFAAQVDFLDIVDKNLREGIYFRQSKDSEAAAELLENFGLGRVKKTFFSSREREMIIEPQDSAGAAELLTPLSTFGFSLLTPDDQIKKIDKIFYQVEGGRGNVERLAEENDEDFIIRIFTEMFSKLCVWTGIKLFKKLIEKFICERQLCEPILLFRQLESNDQQNLIEQLFDWLMEPFYSSEEAKNVIIEILPAESQEDFRLRKFIKLHRAYPDLWEYLGRHEAANCHRNAIPHNTSENEEVEKIKQSRYAEFFLGFSIIWFKTRSANVPTNLISKVEEGDYVIEKLPNETEEDFRLRRFTEAFKRLQFSSQEYIVTYIQNTIFHDLGHPKEISEGERGLSLKGYGRTRHTSDGLRNTVFHDQFIKVKTPNLRGGGATTLAGGVTTQAGGGATIQGGGGGGGGGQGTSQQ